MNDRQVLQNYLIEEFYDDYRAGEISRRTFVRRVAFITGGMAAAVPAMIAVGCTPSELPKATDPIPAADTPAGPTAAAATAVGAAATLAPTSVPPSEPRSPLSVAADDPAVSAATATFVSDVDGAPVFAYLAKPAAADGPVPGILVCHENRGLTAHIEDVARRLAKAGYAALAIDLCSREGGTATLDRDKVPGLLTDAGPERHVADFISGGAFLKAQSGVDPDRLGMTGYCFGGGITWRCATKMADLKAAVPFYGPAPDLADVPNIKAAVFGVYAELDERIGAGVPALEEALKAANITYQVKIYPGVNHAFHNDTGDRYVEAQATQAWEDTMAWFTKYV
ncbi:MAG: dienelactone hydrolase family protein [Ardenticatenales bacterium]